VIVLTLYSRPGCHLCDVMKATIARVTAAIPSSIEEIDISQSAELEEKYGLEIPVLLIDGKKAAKGRISESELIRILGARTAPPVQ
jgi:glutaredoxin